MGRFLKWGNWFVAKLIEVLFNTNYLIGCRMYIQTYKSFGFGKNDADFQSPIEFLWSGNDGQGLSHGLKMHSDSGELQGSRRHKLGYRRFEKSLCSRS